MSLLVPPGSTIGLFGGGQLGRMVALAARPLGYRVHLLDPDPDCAARPVADRCLTAAFDDAAAAAELARGCDVVTLEIEKVSQASLEAAARHAPVRPGPAVLAVVRDKRRQKDWLAGNGFPVGPYRHADSVLELERAVGELGGPCFAKAAMGGYDGRGQLLVARADLAAAAWQELGGGPLLVERVLDLELELSVLVARRPGGESAVYPIPLNRHERQVLAWSVLPGRLPEGVSRQAEELGRAIAEALGVEGLLAVELFRTRDGWLLVNELAPRPHNTFHGTLEACLTSQFEQLVRAVCDLPLGSVEVLRPTAIVNVFGDLWSSAGAPDFAAALEIPGVRLHLYGKEPRPGRKVGHLAAVADSADEAVRRVLEAAGRLRRDPAEPPAREGAPGSTG
ncbi:MAG: 5-(carboxyamino)imidazole ribonucleotide synthase [Gemmatimonadetes bacterium]|nr:5-(carboxyamino)imidazole ribonucleotide synthase [Gemmatimonadota bacterium]